MFRTASWKACGCLRSIRMARRQLKVEEFWPHKGQLVLKFEGSIRSRTRKRFCVANCKFRRSDRAELEPGWTYISELTGCSVFDGDREIGTVEGVEFGAGEAPLLIVRGKAKLPYEIPFAEAYLDGRGPGYEAGPDEAAGGDARD